MSFQAVGWLSTKLGINIGGRKASDGDPSYQPPSDFNATSKIDACFSKINDVVFGSEGCGSGNIGAETALHGIRTGDASDVGNSDVVELDENGLPVSKNWYYFDKDLNRWNVSPDAPEKIKQEFQRRLEEEEDERTGKKAVPPPPPPPLPTQPTLPSFAGAPLPQLQPGGHSFNPGVPNRGARSHLPFNTQRSDGVTPHRQQYAVPDYFGTTESSSGQLTNTHQVAPQQFSCTQPSPQFDLNVGRGGIQCTQPSQWPNTPYPPYSQAPAQPPLQNHYSYGFPQETIQQQASQPAAYAPSSVNQIASAPFHSQTQWQAPQSS